MYLLVTLLIFSVKWGMYLHFTVCVTVQLIFLKISHPGPTSSAGALELVHQGAAPFQLDGETWPSCPAPSSALWLAAARTQERDWFFLSTHKPCQRHLSACPELLTRQTRLGPRASNAVSAGLFLTPGLEQLKSTFCSCGAAICPTVPHICSAPSSAVSTTCWTHTLDWSSWFTSSSSATAISGFWHNSFTGAAPQLVQRMEYQQSRIWMQFS